MTPGKNEPDISVVLCTYNGEAFIQEQLESILTQSIPPDEIVISDDGSSDETLARIKAIQDSSTGDIRWVVITRDKPLGPAENFAHALTVATGELIALSDQDDIWESTKLAVLRSHFQKHPDALLVHTNARLIDSAGREGKTLMATLRLTAAERKALTSGRGLQALLRRNLVTGATVMLSRTLLETALPLPAGWVHDEWWGLIAALQDGLIYEDQSLVRYRQHAGNVIGASDTTVSVAQERLAETRDQFFTRKRIRNSALSALCEEHPPWLPPRHREALLRKIAHDKLRETLPAGRLARVPQVFWWGILGNYRRSSRGWIDMVRDISLLEG